MTRKLLSVGCLALGALALGFAGGCANTGEGEAPYSITGSPDTHVYQHNQIDEVNRGKARAKGDTYFYNDPYARHDMTPAVR